jgi:hypothetical protein
MTEIKAQTEIGRCCFVKTPEVVDITDREENREWDEGPGPLF